MSFTGTRKGLSDRQRTELTAWLTQHAYLVTDIAHGNCIGAYVEFHALSKAIIPACRPRVFPSDNARTRAPIPADAYFVDSFRPPLVRNPLIVEAGPDMLLVCPATMTEQQRSGTWATYRAGRKRNVPYKIFWRY